MCEGFCKAETLFGPDKGSPKFQLHTLAPVDWSVKKVRLLKHAVVAVNAAVGFGFTVITFVIVSAHPLPLVMMSVTE